MTETPSLTVFLNRFESASHTIKRDLDSVNDEVRVMTVHGAKGLEAPIVVLIDGCEVLGRDPALLQLQTETGDRIPVWSPGRNSDSGAMAAGPRTPARQGPRGAQPAALRGHDPRQGPAGDRALPDGRQRDPPQEAWCEMIRHGLVAKAGGLERDEAPYGADRGLARGLAPRTPARRRSGRAAARSRRRAGLADAGGRRRSPSPCRRSAPRARSAPPTA